MRWEITKLLGPAKWAYCHLLVILDIFSQNVMGRMVPGRDIAELANRLIPATSERLGIIAATLIIRADCGTSMTSKPVALMFAALGLTKTFLRPLVSEVNLYSENQFKALT